MDSARAKMMLSLLVISGVILGQGLLAPSASAHTSSTSIQTVTDAGGSVTSVSGGTAASKQAWLAAHPVSTRAGTITPNYTISNKELYSSGRTNMYGSYSSVSGKTDADVTSGWEEYADFKNSSATVDWWGGSPVNARELQASMKWEVHGLDVSVSIPAGVGFSRSGTSITWEPPAVGNTWHETLSRSASVHFWTPFTFYSEYFWSDANVLLGTTWYYVKGN